MGNVSGRWWIMAVRVVGNMSVSRKIGKLDGKCEWLMGLCSLESYKIESIEILIENMSLIVIFLKIVIVKWEKNMLISWRNMTDVEVFDEKNIIKWK